VGVFRNAGVQMANLTIAIIRLRAWFIHL